MTRFAPMLIVVLTLPLLIHAAARQDPVGSVRKPTAATATIDGLIGTLYRSVSFPAQSEPDWKLLRSLVIEGAIFVQPAAGGKGMIRRTTDEFIELFKGDLDRFEMRKTGFHERAAAVRTTRFGNIAHCLVVFEMRQDPESKEPIGRGVDSIQLVFEKDRWWVASITTEYERPGQPIPAGLLEKKG